MKDKGGNLSSQLNPNISRDLGLPNWYDRNQPLDASKP